LTSNKGGGCGNDSGSKEEYGNEMHDDGWERANSKPEKVPVKNWGVLSSSFIPLGGLDKAWDLQFQ